MKYWKRGLSLIVAVVMILSVAHVFSSTANAANTLVNDVKTYTSRGTILATVGDEYAYPSSAKCTAMQGMTATENYIYAAKIQSNNAKAFIKQYNIETGNTKTMEYYSSVGSTEQVLLDNVRHCNDMTTHIYDEQTYLIAANAYHPTSSSYASPCLTSFLLDEENGKMYFTGFYNLKYVNSLGNEVYLAAGSIRWFNEDETHDYYLIKDANNFYWCKIAKNDLGGGNAGDGKNAKASEIMAYRLFTIDNRNAVFANADGSTYTIDNLELWTNQGCAYSPLENAIYVPLWDGVFTDNSNVILIFNVGDRLKLENLKTENVNDLLFSTKRNFHITGSGKFELESCVIRDQGDGMFTLYYNTNGKTTATEGIYSVTFAQNDDELISIVDEKSIVYTVEYNYGVDGVAQENWLQSNVNYKSTMLSPTIHVAGNTTNLRVNKFYRDGYTFTGYNLYRHSDEMWLYADDSWYTESEAPAEVEKALLASAAAVDNLTTVDGDTITAYAQWEVTEETEATEETETTEETEATEETETTEETEGPEEPEVPEETDGKTYIAERLEGIESVDELATLQSVDTVILAGEGYPADALAGSVLAAQNNATVLLANSEAVDYIANSTAITKVIILGGEDRVSADVASALSAKEVTRLTGSTASEVSLSVLEALDLNDTTSVIVTSEASAMEAVSAAGYAGADNMPILYVSDTNVDSICSKIGEITPSTIYIIGGTEAVSAATETALTACGTVKRIAGSTPEEISVLVATEFGDGSAEWMVFANADNAADTLVSTALAAYYRAAILLVDEDSANTQREYVKSTGILNFYVAGDTTVYSDELVIKTMPARPAVTKISNFLYAAASLEAAMGYAATDGTTKTTIVICADNALPNGMLIPTGSDVEIIDDGEVHIIYRDPATWVTEASPVYDRIFAVSNNSTLTLSATSKDDSKIMLTLDGMGDKFDAALVLGQLVGVGNADTDTNASFTLNPGVRLTNSSNIYNAGAVTIYGKAVFNGGVIDNCWTTATSDAACGAVNIQKSATLTMKGGTITNNRSNAVNMTSSFGTGGVNISSGGYFIMTGGAIYGNETTGGYGIGLRSPSSNSKVTISGDAYIDNVLLVKDAYITTSGKLTANQITNIYLAPTASSQVTTSRVVLKGTPGSNYTNYELVKDLKGYIDASKWFIGSAGKLTQDGASGTEYTLNSTDWLNEDFVVTANDGYTLSRTRDVSGTWSDTLTASDETAEGTLTFYVKNTTSGVVSSAVTVNYKIDKTAPVISGVEDAGSYYGNTSFTVTEANLAVVKVDETEVALDENNSYTIKANGETHEISVTDLAGNSTVYTITVYVEETTGQPVEITVNNVGAAASGAVLTAPENGWVEGANTFTVSCEKACVVAVSYDGGATYTRLTATESANGYSFTAKNMTADTIVAVAVAGDVNGDGLVDTADQVRMKAAILGYVTLDNLENLISDVNDDEKIDTADSVKLKASVLQLAELAW